MDDTDNTESAVSEELSHLSTPMESQNSSCTSIFNPFYDGPSQPAEEIHEGPSRLTSRRCNEVSCQLHQTLAPQPTTVNTVSKKKENIEQRVVIMMDFRYLCSCFGFLQLLQLVMSVATLVCLVSAGKADGGLLNLPLSWHFRIMLFVLVLTLLVNFLFLFGNITSLIAVFGFEWNFFDMIIYSLFAFLYLVGSSLVASAFDFYKKMHTDVSKETIDQLVTSVILGYVCMVLHGMTGFMSYRKWKMQYRLYQRRKLIEEDEIDL